MTTRKNYTARIACLSALCALLFISACTKQESSGPQYFMSAMIGGTPFSRDSCSYASYGVPVSGYQILGWAGYVPSESDYYPQIEINMLNVSGVGTYTLPATSPTASVGTFVAQVWLSNTSIQDAVSGTVSLISVYPSVAGTFSFICADGTVVSNGRFAAQGD